MVCLYGEPTRIALRPAHDGGPNERANMKTAPGLLPAIAKYKLNHPNQEPDQWIMNALTWSQIQREAQGHSYWTVDIFQPIIQADPPILLGVPVLINQVIETGLAYLGSKREYGVYLKENAPRGIT